MTNYTLQASREWWSQQWLDLLDSYRFKKRLERARNYARQGNVLSIEFKGAKVLARVQGSEVEPYKVSLSLEPFSDEQWGYVIETMSQRAIFAAKLLAGEMPQNIEEVFTANGLSIFPFTLGDVQSKCSCPDKANPCKHIGALYYQLGDRFSEDPFVLFQLRGRTKEQIISDLRQLRSANKEPNTTETPDVQQSIPNNKYSIRIDYFWQYNEPLESSLVVIAPSTSEMVLDVLGAIPLAKEEESAVNSTSSDVVMKYLNTVYRDVSQKAFLTAMNVGGN
ncbi:MULTISPECIES: SWIM zinc finger family protein [unclassified Nostoc]|uniref:SWIM zinc finger family protein n=1 Tax=unclassified Nostoc TaxID=2593658 RepID=UPI0025AA3BB8|nr:MULTISPECIES: SWIM zinc finger family protein [unclassified Nostoc]MDM9584170.1 SWIM zinc finger family protein [Nostoc sp. GT001]MDZ7947820.1 SWIM zinc finger family protein [Nostoc sp. EfeVER01]MDZ7994382.1 SWIM zinc finger family protein [Nostoc sp. EspVER01]